MEQNHVAQENAVIDDGGGVVLREEIAKAAEGAEATGTVETEGTWRLTGSHAHLAKARGVMLAEKGHEPPPYALSLALGSDGKVFEFAQPSSLIGQNGHGAKGLTVFGHPQFPTREITRNHRLRFVRQQEQPPATRHIPLASETECPAAHQAHLASFAKVSAADWKSVFSVW